MCQCVMSCVSSVVFRPTSIHIVHQETANTYFLGDPFSKYQPGKCIIQEKSQFSIQILSSMFGVCRCVFVQIPHTVFSSARAIKIEHNLVFSWFCLALGCHHVISTSQSRINIPAIDHIGGKSNRCPIAWNVLPNNCPINCTTLNSWLVRSRSIQGKTYFFTCEFLAGNQLYDLSCHRQG